MDQEDLKVSAFGATSKDRRKTDILSQPDPTGADIAIGCLLPLLGGVLNASWNVSLKVRPCLSHYWCAECVEVSFRGLTQGTDLSGKCRTSVLADTTTSFTGLLFLPLSTSSA